MRYYFCFVLVLSFLSIDCSTPSVANDQGKPLASATRDTAPAPPIPTDDTEEFTPDLAGQARRIMAEGWSEAAVQKNLAEADKSVTFEHLTKNADRYAGRPWTFTGKIVQIQESDGATSARVALDEWGNKIIYVVAPFTTDFVDKNRVSVVGYLAGNYTYTSQANYTITIPAVVARSIAKPGGKK